MNAVDRATEIVYDYLHMLGALRIPLRSEMKRLMHEVAYIRAYQQHPSADVRRKYRRRVSHAISRLGSEGFAWILAPARAAVRSCAFDDDMDDEGGSRSGNEMRQAFDAAWAYAERYAEFCAIADTVLLDAQRAVRAPDIAALVVGEYVHRRRQRVAYMRKHAMAEADTIAREAMLDATPALREAIEIARLAAATYFPPLGDDVDLSDIF